MNIAKTIAITSSMVAGSAFSQNTFNNHDLCKAAISSEMGHPAKSMKNLSSELTSPEISYTRKEDGKRYRYNCKIEGNRIIWRAYFNDPVQVGWGRWRDGKWDAVFTFTTKDNTLTVENSATGSREAFQKKDF
nr:hypothetical protein [uncultured Aquabacterium sp.]